MIELRSRDEIEAMRPAGRFVAAVLSELAKAYKFRSWPAWQSFD